MHEDAPAKYVNPLIGTDRAGNTYPGAQVPFGMVQLSPDNGQAGRDHFSGYHYPDSTINGFSHTHLSGSGAGDLYDISFLPVTLPYREAPAPLGIYSRFCHDEEAAGAGYYQVRLSDYNIQVELTATKRCGIQRYTFPQAAAAIFLNLRHAQGRDRTTDSHIEIVDSVTIQGYRMSDGLVPHQQVYFCTRFSRPFEKVRLDTTSIVAEGTRIGTAVLARFDFHTSNGEQIVLRTALSGVSMKGAAGNLQSEAPDNNFNSYLYDARESWNEALSHIRIQSDDLRGKVKFYTALYHTMLAPTLFCDADGSYRGADQKIHQAYGWQNYDTFLLSNTYRAVHPLFTYLEEGRVNDMIKSFLAFYQQYGRLPVLPIYGHELNPQVGYHAVPVIVDAYLKGIGDFNPHDALRACIATANDDDYALEVSGGRMAEYAYDDYCIARMAEKLNDKETAALFDDRSQAYRTQCLQQGDRSYFQWMQYDLESLIRHTGGAARFARRLDSLFTYSPSGKHLSAASLRGVIGAYRHSDEARQHLIYLYNSAKQPWKTQRYAARIMREFYTNQPDGLCGDDEGGQLSAWYVFSALGFYPVDPVSGRYEIGTPQFRQATLRLEDGALFKVVAPAVSRENIYIRQVKINGQPYRKSYLTHRQIRSGVTVEFEMSSTPCRPWYE
jgi:putative alpha-1,2-mannosidase